MTRHAEERNLIGREHFPSYAVNIFSAGFTEEDEEDFLEFVGQNILNWVFADAYYGFQDA